MATKGSNLSKGQPDAIFMALDWSELAKQAPILLLGALITSLAFLCQRWFSNARVNERATRLGVLAQIAGQLKSGQVTVEDLEELERLVERKRKPAPVSQPLPDATGGHQTQMEMNHAAAEELRKLDQKLKNIIEDIEVYLDADEAKAFRRAQASWETFRDQHAAFVADLFAGGSMQPLWYITSVDTATRDRIDELQSYLEHRRGDNR